VTDSACLTSGRPKVSVARRPGSERRSASTEGMRRRDSGPAFGAFAVRSRSARTMVRQPTTGPPPPPRAHWSLPPVRGRREPVDTEERAAFTAAAGNWMVRGGGLDIEIVPQGTLATQEMILNIGPQHPSTHGVLRIILELEREGITRAEPVIVYMHRGAEKLAEYRDTRQVLVLMNRHDWLSAFNNELGWIIAVERLAGIEVPERAQWIRTMLAEWNRILNHLMFMGSYPLELGAI